MKKIFAVVICAVMLVSVTACSNSAANSNGASDNGTSSQVESSSSKDFASMQAYFDASSTKQAVETLKSSISTDEYEFDCYAEGDAFVYEYTYVDPIDEEQIPNLKELLDNSADTIGNSMHALMEELIDKIDIENPLITVKYFNTDGTLITEMTFDKSILEESSSDDSSDDSSDASSDDSSDDSSAE